MTNSSLDVYMSLRAPCTPPRPKCVVIPLYLTLYLKLPFKLIADTDKKVLNDYGVWGEKKFMGRTYQGIHRITFVISEDGVIENIITKVKTKDHSKQILEQEKIINT